MLVSLQDKAGSKPEIVYNLALVRGWLGDLERFAAGLHAYARLEPNEHDAVEAEALAQLMDPKLEDPKLETVRIAFAVEDEDALKERLVEDNRVEDYPLDPDKFDEDTPLPRGSYILLDKPTPQTRPDLRRDEIPRVLGFLSLYGKRTDRAAQLELTTDRTEGFEAVKSLLGEVAGEQLGKVLEEEVVAELSQSEESLSWRWRLPPGTPLEQRNKLVAEGRREAILERWTAAPRAALGCKSPLETVGDPDLRLALLASVLILEQAADTPQELSLFAELRERLGLPISSAMDSTLIDQSHFPIVRVPQLDLTKLTDKQLDYLLNRAGMLGAKLAILVIGGELVSRADQVQDIDLGKVFHQMVRVETDLTRAQELIGQARKWAAKNHHSLSEWALLDLELAIGRGDSPAAQRALEELRTVHISEPGVAEDTYRILYEAGLLSIDERSGPTQLAMPASQAESSGIWTPAGEGEPASAASGGKSVIWTP